ncbi:Uncharacterised protein [Mycobacteroides abscessus subsp. abscessus]|uniref:Uncharacterized protein n=1 Tax=Mycobacteroides abscessus subsp. abscessus TaxID=1185650 RepID=A0AB38CSW6_9MYCO|nr:Uncharacterised protein [Mycobacteroides abscessus subsp. abscessus]SIA30545.1 Uncharacterised protein [Mycobacteroides abscessus subsp. abscessus]SIA32461.1 Uncharacterised protein [Mycobacteroides abscessus subsp. abscessus]SIA48117.1 Uncharacterised protein [Mycobacteroides abscessus subsp. abscessus]SIB16924.1 Uncharacterised protein [Mycobacteroides abscessus subsp. abscessus]
MLALSRDRPPSPSAKKIVPAGSLAGLLVDIGHEADGAGLQRLDLDLDRDGAGLLACGHRGLDAFMQRLGCFDLRAALVELGEDDDELGDVAGREFGAFLFLLGVVVGHGYSFPSVVVGWFRTSVTTSASASDRSLISAISRPTTVAR